MKRVQAAVAAIAVGLGFSSAASAACQLQQTAEFKLTVDGNHALVEGAINGQPVQMEVDTGTSSTLLFPAAVQALGLKAFEMQELKAYGVGGGGTVVRTAIREFRLGDRTAHNINLLVSPTNPGSQRYAGLVGEDFLGQGDLELDFADNAARLFKPKDCVGDEVAYWAKSYDVTPLVPTQSPSAVQVYVMLNGQHILAEIDSGASTSIITTGAALVAGVTPQSVGVRDVGPSEGLGPRPVQTFVAVFPTFTIGDETIKNAKLGIADLFAADTEVPLGFRLGVPVVNTPQMLLGADFIRAHRIYIARSQGKVYFSYNGGPIFQGPQADATPAPKPSLRP
jgi:hypothetical protein